MTLYLEGSVPVFNSQSRALGRDLAIAGHDYFEVVFYYRVSSSSGVIAKTSWELYKDAHIRGVRGKGEGETPVDYGAVSVSGLANGAGAAILFVGKKTDKTLLAVGRLALVNGTPGTQISPATTSVTFEVVALDCGVGYTTVSGVTPNTSFLTDYRNPSGPPTVADTRRDMIDLPGRQFDLFKLIEGGTTEAEYHFRTVGETSNTRISAFLPGIIVAGEGAYEKKQPRYPRPDGSFQYFSVILDNNTAITPVNNLTVGVPFANPIQVTFNTGGTTPGSVFAFVFQIPVSLLSMDVEAGTWYIRASYDSFWLDLDHNITSGEPKTAGGAVLIGTGEVSILSAYRIRVIVPPLKYLYPYAIGSGPDNVNGGTRRFNVDGMLVELQRINGAHVRWLRIDELTFELGMMPIRTGDVVSQLLYGIQTIIVSYFDVASAVPYSDSFIIICDNLDGNYTTIPANHYIVIDDSVNMTDVEDGGLMNIVFDGGSFYGRTYPGGPGTFVVVATKNFNFTAVQLQQADNPFLIIVVAGERDGTGFNPGFDVALGRTNDTRAVGAFNSWGTENAFYFGPWPFNTPLRAQTPQATDQTGFPAGTNTYTYAETIVADGVTYTRHRSYPYRLNAGGLHTDFTPPATPAETGTGVTQAFFLQDRMGGSIYNVQTKEVELEKTGPWLY